MAAGLVVLGVAGGIAAYRAIEVLRRLRSAGCRVQPILTRNATRFVSPRTFSVLAGRPAQVSLWRGAAAVDHVELAREADLLLIAPATANVLAKLAAGVADDALTTYALAHRREVVVAPAMNTHMLRHPATQEALAVLRHRGIVIVAPGAGMLACGDVGEGRLAEVDEIVTAALAALPHRGPLAGLSMLVTAGPTREPIDLVRVLTNRSSGRMGCALAAAGRRLGASVRLLVGAGVTPPPGIPTESFETTADLERLLALHAAEADSLWHAAAVADFRPAEVASVKLDRRAGGVELKLDPTPDLAAGLPRRGGRPYLVIFAAERAADLEARARHKLLAKNADAVVANPIDEPGLGMEAAANRAVVITRSGTRRELPAQSKEVLARELLLTVVPDLLAARAV
ncbi:MAG: bifunctional phosphopantothenoylcysteine decarboxylase/phosphopantothenate--cysteine ligase CoaBC [Acidobacteriota bacterium]